MSDRSISSNLSTPVYKYLNGVESWESASQDARIAFYGQMKGKAYGIEPTRSAWDWFLTGWNGRSAPETKSSDTELLRLIARMLPYVQQFQAADFAELEALGSVCRAAEKALASFAQETPEKLPPLCAVCDQIEALHPRSHKFTPKASVHDLCTRDDGHDWDDDGCCLHCAALKPVENGLGD